MVRAVSLLLPLSLTATVVNAQLGEIFKNALGGAFQRPLGSMISSHTAVVKNTHDITSENWRSSINVVADPTANEDAANEWYFYFTTTVSNGTAEKNVTYWDVVYNDTVRAMSTVKPVSTISFGRVDCAAPESTELCHTFFLNAPIKLPVFYHIATYLNNGTTEFRRVPMWRNITEANEQPEYLVRLYTEKEWKTIEPWTGLFHPITGRLKDYAPQISKVLQYFEMMPQWLFMVVITLFSRTIMGRMNASRMGVQPARETVRTVGDATGR